MIIIVVVVVVVLLVAAGTGVFRPFMSPIQKRNYKRLSHVSDWNDRVSFPRRHQCSYRRTDVISYSIRY